MEFEKILLEFVMDELMYHVKGHINGLCEHVNYGHINGCSLALMLKVIDVVGNEDNLIFQLCMFDGIEFWDYLEWCFYNKSIVVDIEV